MFKNTLLLFGYMVLFVILLSGLYPEITYSETTAYDFTLFIPTIVFLVLLYVADREENYEAKMKYAIGTFVFAIASWLGFMVI